MALCKPKARREEPYTNITEEAPKKAPKKDRATIEKEFIEEHTGVFSFTPVHWLIVIAIFVPLLWVAWQRWRPGMPINNGLIQYGPVPQEITYAYWVVGSFIVMMTTVTWIAKLGTKMLTIRGLWVLYFLVGTMFNLVSMDILPVGLETEYQIGQVRHTGFICTSWMHLIVEPMIMIAAIVPKSQCDWYWTRFAVYGYIINFLAAVSRQKTFSIYILVGGVGSLPSDTFTIIAAYAIWKRAKDASVKLFAVAVGLHMPSILLILSFMNWGSMSDNNMVGFALMFTQFQYACLAYVVSKHVVLRDLPDDELEKELREKGILPYDPAADDGDDEEAGGVMKPPVEPVITLKGALMVLNVLVTVLTVVYVVLPLVLGYMELKRFVE
mmetsp:Transcript_23490/g.60412  ORF Transcript_23490/g.60412 Transcript_23490/m.60412 type:complete len:383 (+) Transcript_23490:154-1302(+)